MRRANTISTGATLLSGRPSPRAAARAALLAGLLAIASLASTGTPAFAASTHPFAGTFFAGAGCRGAQDVASDETTHSIYVFCAEMIGAGESRGSIRKFDANGNPVDFSASEWYVSGNEITNTPNPHAAQNDYHFFDETTLAVDNSGGPNAGDIYVTSFAGSSSVDVFSRTGEWLGSIPVCAYCYYPKGIDVDQHGNVYVPTEGGYVTEYNTALNPIRRLYTANTKYSEWGLLYVRIDSTGAAWVKRGNAVYDGGVYKFEADQFGTNIEGLSGATPIEIATPSPLAPAPLIPPNTRHNSTYFDVDLSNNDLYLDDSEKITPFSPGAPGDPAHPDGPSFGQSILSGSHGVLVTNDGRVYASNGNAVSIFNRGFTLPNVTTNAPTIPDVGHYEAKVTGRIDPAGGGDITACQVDYGTDTSYSLGQVPCSPDPASTNFTVPTDIEATLPGLSVGTTYHYRVDGSNAHGQNIGGDRTLTTVAVLNLTTDPATNIDTHSATLHGTFNPDSMSTSYHFEYGLTTEYRQSTPPVSGVTGSGNTTVNVPVDGLQAGKTYHYRIVATNSLGTTYGPDETVKVAIAPEISGLRATDLSATGATLNARVNPEGYETSYHFEYGTTPAYGTSVPISDTAIGNASTEQDVSNAVSNLQPGIVYHFRIVATNEWGTSASDDTTFSFSPPGCPNAHIRQLTSSNYLPDCRAYELVSPADAGSAQVFPSNESGDFGVSKYLLPFAQWPQNSGLASNPSRFSFYGGLGAVPGLDPPNAVIDTYLATRTTQGWVTTLPGVTGSEALGNGYHLCSLTLNKCLDHADPNVIQYVFGTSPEPETAPYLFGADGKKLGQLPTNVNVIPGGKHFKGDQRPSGDFTHFAFSSRELPFTPDGLTAAPGSAYDNNLVNRTVTKMSLMPDGTDIPPGGGGGSEAFITFGGISPDGSHILMRTAASGGWECGGYCWTPPAYRLYMRVNDSITYDVSRGAAVNFVGMTSDGSKVFFTTNQQLPTTGVQDTDTSTDLYMWSEAGDTLTLVSQGNGQGNSDACNAAWTSKCNVAALATERGERGQFTSHATTGDGYVSYPGIDSQLASQSGDIFFYSSENLDSTRLATPSERNLYYYRNGQVHFVATLDPGTEIDRIQISPDGSHAAFLTASRLTGYDNRGFREMYTYNAATGVIRCASCNPSGQPPTADVQASQGGPFMSNDGRTFFATRDALVPQDTDSIIDTYEFVDGRPQLISSGTGTRDFSASGVETGFFKTEHIGLEAVSADGVDVYFTTYDTLVSQDRNGAFVKVYDARTGGGFEPAPPLAPCAAADECHGVGSSPPATPQMPTGASLGSGGNVVRAARTKRHHHRRRHRRHVRHRHG